MWRFVGNMLKKWDKGERIITWVANSILRKSRHSIVLICVIACFDRSRESIFRTLAEVERDSRRQSSTKSAVEGLRSGTTFLYSPNDWWNVWNGHIAQAIFHIFSLQQHHSQLESVAHWKTCREQYWASFAIYEQSSQFIFFWHKRTRLFSLMSHLRIFPTLCGLDALGTKNRLNT